MSPPVDLNHIPSCIEDGRGSGFFSIAAGTAVCAGGAITLDTGLTTATHTWYYEGDVIPGETGPVISATQDGNYSVDIVYSASCQTSDSIYIELSNTINSMDNLLLDIKENPKKYVNISLFGGDKKNEK